MVDYLFANNYKSFVNFKVEFGRLNLVLGKNGSGKSNVFTLIFSLLEIVRGNNNALGTFFSPTSLTRWTKSRIQTFELGLSDPEHKYNYKLEIEQNLDLFQSKIISEKITCDNHILYQMEEGTAILYDDDAKGMAVLTDNNISGISFAPIDSKHQLLAKFKNTVNSILLCSPDPKAMTGLVEKEEFGAKVNFSNIASIYASIVQTDTDVYSEFMSVLKEIFPNLKRFTISMDPLGRKLQAVYEYNNVPCLYAFAELSDGEKMIFSLYLLLYGFIKKGYTVLLDEPDNYLSLREIQPWCTEIENEISDFGQCIMISHHPEIIDHLAAMNGIWMSRLRSGESVVTKEPQSKLNNNADLLKYSEMIARGLLDEET